MHRRGVTADAKMLGEKGKAGVTLSPAEGNGVGGVFRRAHLLRMEAAIRRAVLVNNAQFGQAHAHHAGAGGDSPAFRISILGTDARVGKRFLGRIRDDDTVFALRCDPGDRDLLLEMEPDVFFTTDHYRGYPYVLIHLAAAEPGRLAPLVERAWREAAPKRMVAARDRARPG